MDSGAAFVRHANWLADWTWKRLVQRTDAWGCYVSSGKGQYTQHGELTLDVIRRHFQARSARDVIGLHIADCDNQCRSGALDIDQHGDDQERTECNRVAAIHWYGLLRDLGLWPLLTSSNGKGGFHLRLCLKKTMDAGKMFRFLRHLTRDHKRLGLDKAPEQFPKQADVRRCSKRLGNWIRLPGRHPRRRFWSQVWDGSDWLVDDEAVAYILSLGGDDPAFVPDVKNDVSPRPLRVYDTSRRLENRITAYMLKLPNLGEGDGRDDVAYRFAAFLVRDLALSDEEAIGWLDVWDLGNKPPKGTERLRVILKNARVYGQHTIGSGLR